MCEEDTDDPLDMTTHDPELYTPPTGSYKRCKTNVQLHDETITCICAVSREGYKLRENYIYHPNNPEEYWECSILIPNYLMDWLHGEDLPLDIGEHLSAQT